MTLAGSGAPEAYQTPLLGKHPPLMQNRNFGLLWLGYVISALGDRVHFIVMLTLISNLISVHMQKLGILHAGELYEAGTRETAQLTIMMLAPFVLLGPFTGMLADRLPRRMIMLTSDLVRVVIVVAARVLFLRENSVADYALLYGLLLASEFLIAIFSAAFSPARLALLPQLVHPEQLLRANSMTNAAGTIASLIGFVAGGWLVKQSLNIAMFADAGTFLGSAICLVLMRIPKKVAEPAIAKKKANVFLEIAEGLRYIRHHQRVFQIILLMLLFWSCGTIILNGLTGIVTHTYHLKLYQYSYFMGVVGVGMIFGAASVSLFRHGFPKEIGIAWAMVATGVFLFGFSQTGTWPWGLAFLIVSAAAGAVLLVSLDTLLQRIVPNFIRGRVMGAKDVITTLGLVSVAIPLALYDNIDEYIRLVLCVLSVVVVLVGLGLVVYYYRRQTLPVPVAIIRRLCMGYLTLWHRFQRLGACTIPTSGPVIVVANHTSGLDPLAMQVSSPRRVIHFMMAREYYEKAGMQWFFRAMGGIPVNRSGTEISSVRAALRALQEGKTIGMFPEGRISTTGEMLDARVGVAALVLMSGATVVPAYIAGTLRHESIGSDFKRRARISIRYGRPMAFKQDVPRARDKQALESITAQIMSAIGALGAKTAPADEKPARL